jgi:hypothetical protein
MNQHQVIKQVIVVKARHEPELLELANVVGVGIGFKEVNQELTDQIAIIVNVIKKMALVDLAAEDIVPPDLDGVSTDVQEVGQLTAF